tara:strand:- start:1749 stop:2027 length:279 start_codon:yes stop_codon:yes gene_type:complete
MANRKKPTNKELHADMMLNRQAMVNIDNHFRRSIQEVVEVFTAYVDFNKDRKKFEKYIANAIKKAKKEAEKKAKSQENKEVTAKEKSEVPNK